MKEWLHPAGGGTVGGARAPPLTRRLTVAWEVARAMRYLEEATPTVMHR